MAVAVISVRTKEARFSGFSDFQEKGTGEGDLYQE